MAPAGTVAAFHPSVGVSLPTAPDCWRISSCVGGSLVAQPTRRAAPARVPRRILGDCMSALVQFQDQPIDLGADAHNDFADDVNHLAFVGVDRAGTTGAGREE